MFASQHRMALVLWVTTCGYTR